jgi:hypothetical protein
MCGEMKTDQFGEQLEHPDRPGRIDVRRLRIDGA